jgi:hypothetical protein
MNTTVKNLFVRFCEVYNLRTRENITLKRDNPSQPDYYSHEFIKMDYNPSYGGYRMDVVKKGTGERFFSDMGTRRSAKEMIAYLQGLLAAKHSYNFDGIIK